MVDASLIVALLVADERQAAAQAQLESWVDSGEELHAPAVLPYEVANVLARLVGRSVMVRSMTRSTRLRFMTVPGVRW